MFLQLLDADVYADVKSIRNRRRALFYLRRRKEAMIYFPERQPDGRWAAKPIFTWRIPHTRIDGDEFALYQEVNKFIKRESRRAAEEINDPRSCAIGFLMSLYQHRRAYAVRRSLEKRARRLEEALKRAHRLAREAPPDLPDVNELEEMDEAERERVEQMIEAVTLAKNNGQVRREVEELRNWPKKRKPSRSQVKKLSSTPCCGREDSLTTPTSAC